MTLPLDIRRRVFVRGLNWVGDAVLSTPALRRLRRAFAGSHIVLMVRPWVAAVHENSPDIDELWTMDDSGAMGLLRAARRVRAGRFDLGIALPNSPRSALLLTLGGIPRRVGHARGFRRHLLTRPVEIDPKLLREHQVHYYLNLVEWMTDGVKEPPRLVLRPGEAERAEAAEMLAAPLAEGRLLAGIAPGSINSMAKRWLPERFAAVADRLREEQGAEVFLLGSAAEKDVLDRVEKLCKGPVRNLGGSMPLSLLIAFMERLHLFAGNDSGAMHLAAALGVPSVAIFGPTEWATTSPFSSVARVLRRETECAPCMLRICPIDHRCMTRIGVEDVFAEIAQLAPAVAARRRESFEVRPS